MNGKTEEAADRAAGKSYCDHNADQGSRRRQCDYGQNQLKRPPTWLIDNVAKKEWRRIVKELEKINLIGNLDRNNLGGYCNAFANYVKATEILKDQTYYIDRETRNGVIVVKNPMVDIRATYAEEMRKFASLCGLTIDARLKAAAVKSDKTREAITNKFGNI